MYYDIEVRLTQGWFAVYQDMLNARITFNLARGMQYRGYTVRVVPHNGIVDC